MKNRLKSTRQHARFGPTELMFGVSSKNLAKKSKKRIEDQKNQLWKLMFWLLIYSVVFGLNKSAETRTWFTDNSIDTLESWLPYSLDLNIIKSLWSIAKDICRYTQKAWIKLEKKFGKILCHLKLLCLYFLPIDKKWLSLTNIHRVGFTRY